MPVGISPQAANSYAPDPGYLPIPVDPRDEIAYRSEAIERGGSSVIHHFKRAQAYAECGLLDEAEADLRVVLSLESTHVWARYHLGAVEALRGDAVKAAAHLADAVAHGFELLEIVYKDEHWRAVLQHDAVSAVLRGSVLPM